MPLSPPTHLGRYEIRSLLGAGGMGEVYRGTDTKIGREVAVKVLPADVSADPERLSRFEREAQAAGALNHPNILVIYDVGTHDGISYVVSELLEGETLREHMGGSALPQRKAVDYALQMARGLAAAHERRIVHRDLKPENVFVTTDGRVKILDFGLAKLVPAADDSNSSDVATALFKTKPGKVMGTVEYMSPEQVRARQTDHRSDIFSFGAILYEMLSGRQAFAAASKVETMHAILKEDPPELSEFAPRLHPSLRHIVSHCLEKSPEQRFQSARDLAFDLEMLSGLTDSLVSPALSAAHDAAIHSTEPAQAAVTRAPTRRAFWAVVTLAALLAAGASVAAFFAGRRAGATPMPSYRQLTFRRGTIYSARFAPDGRTILYGARWNANPLEIFSAGTESQESRPFGVAGANVLAISSSGEVAVLLNARHIYHTVNRGTLARVQLTGSSPRELLEDVQQADWSPDGQQLAVVHWVGGRNRLEYPIGKVLYETDGYISDPRVSPKGDAVAFHDHLVGGDNRGSVALVDLSGKKRTLTGEWSGIEGLAWSPSGDEIWFTGTKLGGAFALHAVSLDGRERVLAHAPVNLTLLDVSRDGLVMLTGYNLSTPVIGLAPGETKERDLSWLSMVRPGDLSADGRNLVFTQYSEGSGANYAVYSQKTDGSSAVRLGEGQGWARSPDGKWVISILYAPPQLQLLPTGAGQARQLERGPIEQYGYGANWLSDGKRIVFLAKEPGRAMRTYVQSVEGGGPRPVTPEGVTGALVSPDDKLLIASDAQDNKALYPLEGGEPRPLQGIERGDVITRWSADGRSVYVFRRGELPVRVFRLDVQTGRKELTREIMPADPAGISGPVRVFLTPDAKAYVYAFNRYLSDLYLVEGVK